MKKMKKLLAAATSAMLSLASIPAFSVSAQAEPEPTMPYYNQWSVMTLDSYTALLRNELTDGCRLRSEVSEKESGIAVGSFDVFMNSVGRNGADIPIYGGSNLEAEWISLFAKDLYGIPAAYYIISNDIFDRIEFRYPFGTQLAPSGTAESADTLMERAGYYEYENPEKVSVNVGRRENVTAMVEHHENDPRTYVSFVLDEKFVRVVLKTDDLNVLSELSFANTGGWLPGYLRGDVDGDGQFRLNDIVIFTSWLMGRGVLEYPDVIDMNSDGRLDVYDLCLLRKHIVEEPAAFQPSAPDSGIGGSTGDNEEPPYVEPPLVDPVPAEPPVTVPAVTSDISWNTTDKNGNTSGPAVSTSVQTTTTVVPEPVFDNMEVSGLGELNDFRNSGAKEELDFAAVVDSLPVPEFLDGSLITRIRSVKEKSEDNGEDFHIIYITYTLPDNEWVRIEYILSEDNPEQAMFNAMRNDPSMEDTGCYVGDPDNNIKLYYMSRKPDSSGSGEVMTWYIKYPYDLYGKDLYVRAYYRSDDTKWLNTYDFMEDIAVTTVGELK